jgi:sugar transferase (PEP-CTERM system associated)
MKFLGHYVYLPIVLLIAVEFALANLAFGASAVALLAAGWESAETPAGPLVPWALGFSIAVVMGVTAVGLYQAKQRLRIEGVLVRIIVALGIAAVCLALVDFFFSLSIEGPFWALSFALSLVLLGVTRVMFWRWVDHEVFQRRVLVYGSGTRAASLLTLRRRSDRRGFNITAFVPAVGDSHTLDDCRVTKVEGSLLDYAKTNGVDEIVVAMDDRRQGFPISELLSCKFAGIAVVDLLGFLERETGKLKVDLVNPSWLIFSDGFDVPTHRQIAVRTMDFVSGLLLLVLAAPVMFIVAIAVMLDDGHPVLYPQRRVGFRGRTFTLYKFRSMVKDAEAGGAPRWAGKGDTRVTRVGSVIRKLRIDELPQLFNVMRGDMSLVGPRPERPEFVERLSQKIPYYQERHAVKPGITGWAQLCYPYGSSEHDAMEKLQYDLYYIKHKSVIFDLMVLLQTAEVVLWGKGAR